MKENAGDRAALPVSPDTFKLMNASRVRRRIGTALAMGGLTLIAVAVPACATPPPRSASAPDAVRGLTVLVPTPSDRFGSSLALALEAKLRHAGFKIANPEEPHDLEGRLDIDVKETTGLIAVYVNGKQKVGHTATVSLAVLAEGSTIETAQAEFDADDKVDDDGVQKLAAAFTDSDAVRSYAADARAKGARKAQEKRGQDRVQREAEVREAALEAQKREELDDTTWLKAEVAGCKVPGDLMACDAVRDYLAKFPKGHHAAEANQALDAAEPELEKLHKDENTWKSADSPSCRDGLGDAPCAGVEVYVTKYPGGMHADEARRLLKERGL